MKRKNVVGKIGRVMERAIVLFFAVILGLLLAAAWFAAICR